ncbi:hypothetical protein [Gordonia shandongensis]|uniref:hypothetical protein n=1 Tax=Gordonia shandongensis TaxID=376351 RepID=UPI00040336EE|nr:hypothetical protein [Gordonia shandongensis]
MAPTRYSIIDRVGIDRAGRRGRRRLRFGLAAVAASAALLAGSVTTPAAQAAPAADAAAAEAADAAAAKAALDGIAPRPTDAADVVSGIEAANAILKKLGITPFTPTVGACTDFTLAPALGGAMPGPNTPLVGDLSIGKYLDVNLVKSGEVLYGFVPVGVYADSGDKKGMQVAWFNVNTFTGGLGEPMDGLAETIIDVAVQRAPLGTVVPGGIRAALKSALSFLPSNGVRGGLVQTGEGTVLSAIYGTVRKGDATCFFFPSLGIATVK